jgi:hypothetical protein
MRACGIRAQPQPDVLMAEQWITIRSIFLIDPSPFTLFALSLSAKEEQDFQHNI